MHERLHVVELRGRPLRYLLTVLLAECGSLTVNELVTAVEHGGFTVPGRSSKVVSDALRWEIAHRRVVRVGRGRYGPGTMPRQTRDRIIRRVDQLRAEASRVSSGAGSNSPVCPRHSDNRAAPLPLSL